MSTKSKWMRAALALTAFSTLAVVSLTTAPAEAAVVYCKTAGVPQGCVVRPTVVAPAAVEEKGKGDSGDKEKADKPAKPTKGGKPRGAAGPRKGGALPGGKKK